MRLADYAGDLPSAVDEVTDVSPAYRRGHEAVPDHAGVDRRQRHDHPGQQMLPQPRPDGVGDVEPSADCHSQFGRRRSERGNADQRHKRSRPAAKDEVQQQGEARRQIGGDDSRRE